jgi:hypothetical protein
MVISEDIKPDQIPNAPGSLSAGSPAVLAETGAEKCG